MIHTKAFLLSSGVVGLLLALMLAGCDGDDEVAVTVANLNILHGFACDPPVPADGDQCRVADRIDLLVQHIAAADCPDVVTLQEHVTAEFAEFGPGVMVGPLANTVALLQERLPRLQVACDFTYGIVFDPEGATTPPATLGRGIDEELMLTRYPAVDAEVIALYSPLLPFFFRHVLFARIDHPAGPLDVFTTHLAAEADFGSLPCGAQVLPPEAGGSPACPAECDATQDTVRQCQAKQLARFIEVRHDVSNAALVTGDLNAQPFTPVYNEFADRGWLDSHLVVGHAECDPVTGVNCTAGRQDQDLSDLELPALNQDQRIDYQRAEQQALQRSANPEAVQHLTTGLALLAALPETPARAQQELELQLALGPALSATKGRAAPEVEQTYARARVLCAQIGETPQRFAALWGLCQFYLGRGALPTAREQGEQPFGLAQRAADPTHRLEAHDVLGSTLFYLSDYTAALIAFIVWVMPREEKPEYPKHTPTVLPTVPAWTPDPGERGKG